MTTDHAPLDAATVDASFVRRWLIGLLGADLFGADDALLTDLGWDSLTLAEVAVAAEGLVGADLPDELVVELRTIGDVVHYIVTTAGRAQPDRASVSLQPVTGHDEPMLFDWLTAPGHLQRFRLRGVTPSPEALHRVLWDGVLSQYIVCRDDGVAAGLVTCFQPDLRNRFAHLAAVTNPALTASTAVPRGLARFVTELFTTFDLRKLYAEVLDVNLPQIASGLGRLYRHEGCMVAHEFLDGRYVDLHLLAVHRDDWMAMPYAR